MDSGQGPSGVSTPTAGVGLVPAGPQLGSQVERTSLVPGTETESPESRRSPWPFIIQPPSHTVRCTPGQGEGTVALWGSLREGAGAPPCGDEGTVALWGRLREGQEPCPLWGEEGHSSIVGKPKGGNVVASTCRKSNLPPWASCVMLASHLNSLCPSILLCELGLLRVPFSLARCAE